MEPVEGDFEIDAAVVAEGFGLAPEAVPGLMRSGAITSRLYRGVDEDAGTWRMVFFHGNARLTVTVDATGRPLKRSVVDFGDRPLPGGMRKG